MKNFPCPRAALTLLLPFILLSFLSIPSQALSKKELEQAGAILFRDKGCAYCHGATAQGTSRGPSLANLRKTWKAPQIAHQIENGGQKMPSFKEAVSPVELTQLVAYLRAKHRPIAPPVTAPVPVLPS
jgi:mono/diheme cytochrome c family protein